MYFNKKILEFIEESNKIEGITAYNEIDQYEAYMKFLNLKEIDIEDITSLALDLFNSSYASSQVPVLRLLPEHDVIVGNHRPPKSGPNIRKSLQKLLDEVNEQTDSKNAYRLHVEYETLHPLTDCNGRTRRAIWAWLMVKDSYEFGLGFLQKWYYQSLDANRITIKKLKKCERFIEDHFDNIDMDEAMKDIEINGSVSWDDLKES